MLHQNMKVHAQYIKDLSFENPNSPFLNSNNVPDINVMVSINAVKLDSTEAEEKADKKESFHEVTLHVEAKATVKNGEEKGDISFVCDVKYCGILSIDDPSSYDVEELKQLLFINAPTFLFPFVREIIARTTSSGGFLPLMLDPIDFKAMYHAQTEQRKN